MLEDVCSKVSAVLRKTIIFEGRKWLKGKEACKK